ncbi:hypothetical protein [Streptomyces sp. BE133]|uniref:hypothetical protein n=1 Tax=Streptomyces sp. BE133 TaxID=3002523 RepID=UPI002E75C563|nr:hypothetical protein [Streptomyces sp. BE133]MEE1807005.1 hypothetical protein [Streptomyces sp. BE133]
MLVVIVIAPFAGALPDRVGRRRSLTLFGARAVILPLAMFGLMTRGTFAVALAGAVVLACVAGGISGVAASAIAEQFPVASASGASPWAPPRPPRPPRSSAASSRLPSPGSTRPGWASIPRALVAAVALAVIPVLGCLPETAPVLRAPRAGRPAPEPQVRQEEPACCGAGSQRTDRRWRAVSAPRHRFPPGLLDMPWPDTTSPNRAGLV